MQPTDLSLATSETRLKLSGKTVLLADDSETTLRAMEFRCRSLGFKVETATDGLRALLKVTKTKPDLLIIDLNLPDVSGFRVVERLTDPKFPPLPVIVLTAQSDTASIQRCEDLGVLYVHKGQTPGRSSRRPFWEYFSRNRKPFLLMLLPLKPPRKEILAFSWWTMIPSYLVR